MGEFKVGQRVRFMRFMEAHELHGQEATITEIRSGPHGPLYFFDRGIPLYFGSGFWFEPIEDEVWHTEPPQREGVYATACDFDFDFDGSSRDRPHYSYWAGKHWGLTGGIAKLEFVIKRASQATGAQIRTWRELNAEERAQLEQITGSKAAAFSAQDSQESRGGCVAHQSPPDVAPDRGLSRRDGTSRALPELMTGVWSQHTMDLARVLGDPRESVTISTPALSLPSFYSRPREHVAAISSPSLAPQEWLAGAMTGARDETT